MADKMTPKKHKALESLLLDGNVTHAAKAAGVSRNTVYTWLSEPAFNDELRRLEGLALQALGRQLLTLGEKATKALEDALDPAQPMAARLRAAQIVTERGPALAELSAIVARIEALERRREDER